VGTHPFLNGEEIGKGREGKEVGVTPVPRIQRKYVHSPP